ncbi:MAG: PAS domain-containing protein, partial [Acidimicrobiales bacterium]|nr:PAS domain-containing protein [Acidimicrobiales bacterium]
MLGLLLGGVTAVAVVLAVALVLTRRRLAEADHALLAERRRIEGAVAAERHAHDELARALDAIPEAVVIVDAAGEQRYANAAAGVLASARHGDALVAAAVQELVGEALAGERGQRHLDLYGPPRRHLVVTATPLFAGDVLDGALVRVGDETERQRVDLMRRDFVANVSHELKTPVGALSLLSEAIEDEDDPDVVARLQARFVDEIDRLARTIEDLLELSRIEGEAVLELEPVDVAAVVADAVARVEQAAEQRNSHVQVRVPLGMQIEADRRQLASAIANLLDNALKYSDPGSVVDVRALVEDDHAVIAVRDHGIGIPGKDLERV